MKTVLRNYFIQSWLIVLVLSFLVGLSLIGVSLYNMWHADKGLMKEVARTILRRLPQDELTAGNVPLETMSELEGLVREFFDEDYAEFAVISKQDTIIFKTQNFKLKRFEVGELKTIRCETFYVDSVSGSGWADSLKEWRTILRDALPNGRGQVVVSVRSHFEMSERIIEALVASVLFGLVVALFLTRRFYRLIFSPLKTIAQVLEAVRGGDLKARVGIHLSRHEIDRVGVTLDATLADLESMFHRMERFSRDVAHELNTPLTVLRGNLELAFTRERSREELEDLLGQMENELNRLASTVKDLLLMGSAPAKFHARFETVRFDEICRDSAYALQPLADEQAIQLRLDSEEVQLNGAEVLLFRLVYNLLHNAIKFSPSASEVWVRLVNTEDGVVLSVDDAGTGIGERDLPHIFEPFYQADESRRTGTGLGLSLVQWIAEVHGAQVEALNRPEGGARFCVRFRLD